MKQESVPVVNVEVKVHHQKQEEQADVKMQDQASPQVKQDQVLAIDKAGGAALVNSRFDLEQEIERQFVKRESSFDLVINNEDRNMSSAM